MVETSGHLTSQAGQKAIAWKQQTGNGCGVVFLGGFRSDMEGTKAQYLDNFCQKQNLSFTRFDYRGHGASDGHYSEFTIGDWLADTLLVLDTLTTGQQILVGSSLGGWLALLAAQHRPERVKTIIGIAAAPDFPTKLVLPNLNERQRKQYAEENLVTDDKGDWPDPTRFTRHFIEESVAHSIFDKPYRFHGAVRLLQGKKDTAVPWQLARELQEHIEAPEVSLTLIAEGDHRLSTPENLALLGRLLSPPF